MTATLTAWAWALIIALLLGVLAAPLAGVAEGQAKIRRIGFLSWWPQSPTTVQIFRQALLDVGYVEGQNILVEYRWAEGKADRAAEFAAELVRMNVDVIVVLATPAVQPTQAATRTIPIVVQSADPVGTGFVASLPRPGGNITGVSTTSVELAGKRLQLIREILPGIARVAFLASSVDPNGPRFVEQTRVAAQKIGIQIQPLFVRGPQEFDSAFPAMLRERPDALIVQPLFIEHRRRIVEFALRHRLPTVSDQRSFADDGGLMAYGANRAHVLRQIAVYVDKILKGAKPADLPVEEPTRFELVINLKTAKALGLTIPPSVLIRADHVISP